MTKPIVIVGKDWRIPAVTGSTANGSCMEATSLTTATLYVSCGRPATIRLWDDKAKRCYDFCAECADHNLRRGMVLNRL